MPDTVTKTGRGWLAAYTAKMRELRGGREWPFTAGDCVTARGNWGVLCCGLRVHADQNPGAVYTITEVVDGGRWLSLRDADGKVYGPGYGTTYFRLAGECGNHWPQYREGDYPGTYECGRCGQVMPEVTEILRREVPDA